MIAIISDVHGNYPALKMVLDELDRVGCEKIISLGDVTGYYCMINECIDEFRFREITNLMGNHEQYLLGYRKCTRSNTVSKCIEYQKKVITKQNLEYLKMSPMTIDNEIISARHGGWKDPIDEYIKEFDFDIASRFKSTLFCSGHTHIQQLAYENKAVYFNPGSVGQPRDRNSSAAFALINENYVTLHRVSYDIKWIANEMEALGFEEKVYKCLFRGTKIGEA